MAVEYTNDSLVSDIRITDIPYKGRTISGYGGAIPTPYLIRYAGRWHRVKVMQYGNSGSAYIAKGGKILFIDTDTEHRVMGEGRDY